MPTHTRRLLGALVLLLLCVLPAPAADRPAGKPQPSPAQPSPAQPSPAQPALTQFGAIDALLAGGYDGAFPLSELRRRGDLGLGTFDRLDGELVLLDGVVHQAPFDGRVRRPADSLTSPFAQVVRFRAASLVALPADADLRAIEAELDRALGHTDCFAAARLDARFTQLTARSVPRQTRPYRPLAEVAKGQAVFRFENAGGTLVGLRSPDFARGLSVPGWHWHFLTGDRTRGGHVLSLSLGEKASAGLMAVRRFTVLLPEAGFGGLDLARDRSGELKAVEGAPQPAPQPASGKTPESAR